MVAIITSSIIKKVHAPPDPQHSNYLSMLSANMRRIRQSVAIFLLRYRSKSVILFLVSATSLCFYLHAAHVANMISAANEGKTPGFIVLGMHRSGTSMLSGLLVEGFGYDTGGIDMGGSVRPFIIFHLPTLVPTIYTFSHFHASISNSQ